MEGSSHGLICDTTSHLPGRTEENYDHHLHHDSWYLGQDMNPVTKLADCPAAKLMHLPVMTKKDSLQEQSPQELPHIK